MLQRGLSNRPTGAVALLLLGAGYLLNLAQAHDQRGFLAQTLLGAPVKETLVLVEKTGAAIDHVFLTWGEMLKGHSNALGCLEKKRMLLVRRSSLPQKASAARPAKCFESDATSYH